MLFTGTVRLRSNTHELTPQIINSPCDDVFEVDLHKCSYNAINTRRTCSKYYKEKNRHTAITL
jgi:hypothetical protein